jgi:hypothetical protein
MRGEKEKALRRSPNSDLHYSLMRRYPEMFAQIREKPETAPNIVSNSFTRLVKKKKKNLLAAECSRDLRYIPGPARYDARAGCI